MHSNIKAKGYSMTTKEIIDKEQALVSNDIAHYNRRLHEIEHEIRVLTAKKNVLVQKIKWRKIYCSALDSNKEEE